VADLKRWAKMQLPRLILGATLLAFVALLSACEFKSRYKIAASTELVLPYNGSVQWSGGKVSFSGSWGRLKVRNGTLYFSADRTWDVHPEISRFRRIELGDSGLLFDGKQIVPSGIQGDPDYDWSGKARELTPTSITAPAAQGPRQP
jgi:hypothetical protein